MILPDALPFAPYDLGIAESSSPTPSRLRLAACRLERSAGALSRVTVEFDATPDRHALVCKREGPTCVGGDLRLAALATLDGVSQSISGDLKFELVGVKQLRAFDTNLIVVGILVHGEGSVTRMVGTAIADDDLLAGVARATLHAVNRIVSLVRPSRFND